MKWPYTFSATQSIRDFYTQLKGLFSNVGDDMQEQKSRVDNLITNTPQPSEVVDIRTDENGVVHPTARDRIIADKADLQANIDQNKTDQGTVNDGFTAQLADEAQQRANKDDELQASKADQLYVDQVLSIVSTGGPDDILLSIVALNTKYPSGSPRTKLVFDSSFTDGAHSFLWNGTSWQDTGLYQGNGIAADSIGENEIKPKSVSENLTTFIKSTTNHFNKMTNQSDKYYVPDTTEGNVGTMIINSAAGYNIVDPIMLLKGVTYYISYCNTDFTYIADLNHKKLYKITTSPATYTPTKDCYLYLTFQAASIHLDSLMVVEGTSAPSEYIPYGSIEKTIDNFKLPDKSVIPEKTSFITSKRQYIDSSLFTDDKYYYLNNGLVSIGDNASYSTYPKISLKAGTTYYIGSVSGYFSLLEPTDGTSIQRLTATDVAFSGTITPAKDCGLYITTYKVNKAQLMLVNDNVLPNSYTPFGVYYLNIDGLHDVEQLQADVEQLQVDRINTVTVKNDGTGDYTSIVDAVNSITDSSENNQYNVEIYPGIYDIIAELGGLTYLAAITDASSNSSGLLLPNYVHLIGKGQSRYDTWIKGEIADVDATLTNTTKISTINLNQSNTLKNLKITAKNHRYAIHDESANNYQDYTRIMENCYVEHYGNKDGTWTATNALGCGSGSGAVYHYKDCDFVSILPWSLHDNVGFTKANKIVFESCKFMAKKSSSAACRFGTVSGEAETVVHDVEMNNCQFVGFIFQYEEGGKGSKFRVHGGGNTITPYRQTYTGTTAIRESICFNEETNLCTNATASVITRGTPVTLNNNGVAPLGTSDKFLFYGIAIEDIPANGNGYVKNKGFIYVNDTPLSNFGVGELIGITNGALAQVTDVAESIGYCTDWDVILLK